MKDQTLPMAVTHETPDAFRDDAAPRSYHARVNDWMMHCFGEKIGMDVEERNMRFTEEALELVQANGMDRETVHRIVDYVFDRDPGELAQEIGGVSVCLAALSNTADIDPERAAETELARIWEKADKIRAKHAVKPAAIRGRSTA